MEVGVFLNVDHVGAGDDELIDAAIESGRPSSLMVDASDYDLEENVERTATVVDRIDDSGEDFARRSGAQDDRRNRER